MIYVRVDRDSGQKRGRKNGEVVMKPKDSLPIRREMVKMHDEYLAKLNEAMINAKYIEATWLCYAIFEQRIIRILEKVISSCPKKEKIDNKPSSISVRLSCIINLIEKEYDVFSELDKSVFCGIQKWCKKRNELTHGLISLDHYQNFELEFKRLAEEGQNLVLPLYDASKIIREWHNSVESLPEFPGVTCNRKYKCLKEK